MRFVGMYTAVAPSWFWLLIRGVEKSAMPDHNLRQVEDFISQLVVLDYGNQAAAHYGDIRAVLERKGVPMCWPTRLKLYFGTCLLLCHSHWP
jgi:hypothetical protein